MDFDEDPLDLLDDDGDGVIETCLFFDEDGKDNHDHRGTNTTHVFSFLQRKGHDRQPIHDSSAGCLCVWMHTC